MTKIDFSIPQRKDVLGVILSIGFFLRKSFEAFWAFFAYLLLNSQLDIFTDYKTYIVLFIIFVMIAIHSYLSWRYFYFYIKDDEFVIEKGYLKKSITTLPLKKIISVNTNQKLLHQLLGVVEVKVDSAGTDNKEVSISAVKRKFATALEEALSYASKSNAENKEEAEVDRDCEEIISLSPSNLLKIGIARNHIYGLMLLLAFGNQIYYQIKDFFDDEIDKVLSETAYTLEHASLMIWVSVVIFIVIGAIIISFVRTFLAYYDFKFLKVNKVFLLQSGLLKRKKITVPFSRVQAYQQSANPLQRLLNIRTVRLIQASSGNVTKDAEKVLIPGCEEIQLESIKNAIFRKELNNEIFLKPHWALRNRLFFEKCFLLPLLVVPAFFYSWLWVLTLIYLACILLLSHYEYKRREYRIDNTLLYVRSGGIVHANSYIEHYKVQAVRVSQSYFQRRRNTASLHLGLAGAEISLNYIPYETAEKIKDFLLHEIINTKKDWM